MLCYLIKNHLYSHFDKSFRSILGILQPPFDNVARFSRCPFLFLFLHRPLYPSRIRGKPLYHQGIAPIGNNFCSVRYIRSFRSYFFWFAYVQASTYRIVDTATHSDTISFPVSGSPSASEQASRMPIIAIGLCLSVNITFLFFQLQGNRLH